MRLFEYFDRYLVDREYKITITEKQIHIMNYQEIEDFSSSRIVVRYSNGITIFLGSDLVVSKMQDDELLITGRIKTIEYN